MNGVKNRLWELRKENKLTQQKVADKLGISLKCYFSFEHGIRDIPSSKLVALSDMYGVSIDYLLGRTVVPDFNLNVEGKLINAVQELVWTAETVHKLDAVLQSKTREVLDDYQRSEAS